MDSKINGVKVSVNNRTRRTVKKRRAAGKAPNSPYEGKETAKTRKGGLLQSFIIFVITAALIGGGIYAWQNNVAKEGISDVRKDARGVRMDFEKRLANLKNKLTGVESENKELKTANEELGEKAELLVGAKKEFNSSELGFSFEYPAIFGEVAMTMNNGATGTKFMGEFFNNDKLIFGGVSKDFVKEGTSTSIVFVETQGFNKPRFRNKYYFQPAGETPSTDYEINPAKIIDFKSGNALLVNKDSFIIEEGSELPIVDIGENVGALINLKNDNFFGLAFLNMDFGAMPLADFEAMVGTVEVE